ncbi:MAG: hypothetical protein CMP48_12290 [Rickettsiales bacterium]|nr:hypothetical protein [Rickettsiales bacterium]
MKNFIYIIIAGLLVLGCGQSEAPTEEANEESTALKLTKEQMTYNQIEVGKLPKGVVYHTISSTGNVDVPPNHSIRLSAPIEAYLSKVLVLPGDKVKKGQVLGYLTHPSIAELQRNYLTAKSQLEYITKDVVRKSQLIDGKTVSQRNYELLKSDQVTAEANLRAIEADLSRLGINTSSISAESVSQTLPLRAPIAGMVTDLFLKTGEHVNTSEPILSLLNHEHEHVELQVYQQDLSKVKKGMKVLLRLPGETQEYGGEVFLVNSQLSRETLSANIHVHPDEDFPDVAINSVVFGKIVYQADSAFVLSSTEVLKEGELSFAFINSAEGFKKIQINAGYDDGNQVAILGPEEVLTGEVVLKGNYNLNGGFGGEAE